MLGDWENRRERQKERRKTQQKKTRTTKRNEERGCKKLFFERIKQRQGNKRKTDNTTDRQTEERNKEYRERTISQSCCSAKMHFTFKGKKNSCHETATEKKKKEWKLISIVSL